jgi:CPA1 family monovalent cation:H+ antiporter
VDGAITAAVVAHALALMAGGDVFVGIAVGWAAIVLAGRTSDHLVESALTAVAAYGSFLLAEYFHFSGVLATVAAGLLMGNLGVLRERKENILSPDGRAFVVAVWEFAAFSLVFLLIGLRVASIPFTGLGATAHSVAVGLVLAGRVFTVYPLCLLFRRSAWAIPMREQHVLWRGGLRGALALALALALPPSFALHDEILIVTSLNDAGTKRQAESGSGFVLVRSVVAEEAAEHHDFFAGAERPAQRLVFPFVVQRRKCLNARL